MTLSFFVSCVPPTATSQQKRAVRTRKGIRFFKGANQIAAENTLDAVLLPHQPSSPVPGIVAVEVEATWPWRKGDLSTKAKRERAESKGRIPSGSKPDCDNLCKAILDRLASLRFIERDELVAALTVRKFFGAEPGLFVRITSIDPNSPKAGSER